MFSIRIGTSGTPLLTACTTSLRICVDSLALPRVNVADGSNATESRYPRRVRSSLNLGHDVAAPANDAHGQEVTLLTHLIGADENLRRYSQC
jgi:hypothetical protein